MSKFKVGDKVTLNADSPWVGSGTNNPVGVIGVVDEVRERGTLNIHVEWPFGGNSYSSSDLTLVDTKAIERQALSDAMDLCAKYEVKRFCSSKGMQWAVGKASGITLSRSGVLDKLFPQKTPEQLEIGEVEGKLRVLADQLKELKER